MPLILDTHRAFHPTDIQFDGHWVAAKADGGLRCARWAWTGMPRIPEAILQATFFLFDTEEDARSGQNLQGTGFFVGEDLANRPGLSVIYAVSNWHLPCRGASVIRLNRTDGGAEIILTEPHDWIFDPDGHDIAVVPIDGLSAAAHEIRFFGLGSFMTDDRIAEKEVGPGEDVFMAGLFVDAQGGLRNQPAVRFGNISMMPIPLKNGLHATVPTYCLDMHSRSGFSGSPVWVYRKWGQSLTHGNLDMSDQFLGLLGVHTGQFPEEWEIVTRRKQPPAQEGVSVEQDADLSFVKGMSGMTLVAPISALSALLQLPKIRAWYDRANGEPPAVDFSAPVLE